MTEAEWLACEIPRPMLEFLRGRASDRKLRLFAVACAKRILHILTDKNARKAVEFAERFADGLATDKELLDSAWGRTSEGGSVVLREAFGAADTSAEYGAGVASARASTIGHEEIAPEWHDAFSEAWNQGSSGSEAHKLADSLVPASWIAIRDSAKSTELKAQSDLLRDLFGNSFRRVSANPAWLAWNAGTVHNLAQTIYADRNFDRLPILADALEDAGCTNSDILAHCRGDGDHVRGCWVVDLLQGRE